MECQRRTARISRAGLALLVSPGATIITKLIQIIYASQPFGYDEATLRNILLKARNNNMRDDISGALICRRDIYLQLLEGPTVKVQDAIERIGQDDRHIGMKTLVSERVSKRLFADWAMLHDPAKSWIWSEEDVSGGIIDHSTQQDIRNVFETLAEKAKDDLPE